jgi:thiol-disulfide isomerase/thioredoxin
MLQTLFFLLAFSSPSFSADPACDDAGQVYRVCSDQVATFQSAETAAAEKKKKLLVVIGAQWCPWCQSLHLMFDDGVIKKKYEKDFALLEIGLYQGQEKSATGQAVLDKLLGYAGEKNPPKGIPMMVVVDPVSHKAKFIDTEKLEKNTPVSKGHDPEKVLKSIREAAKSLQR